MLFKYRKIKGGGIMPRSRGIKAWTVYPPTQEDRDVIEQKAKDAGLSVSSYLCMVGKLAQVNVITKEGENY